MLWTLIVLLLVFWLLGFAFNVAGGIIHVLLVIAVVLFVVNLLSGDERSCRRHSPEGRLAGTSDARGARDARVAGVSRAAA